MTPYASATSELENTARDLHRRKCRSVGIYDEEKIADYWLGCDRARYRVRAAVIMKEHSVTEPSSQG